MFNANRFFQALVVAVVVWLVCLLLGTYVLPALQFPPVVAIGGFIDKFAIVIGVVAGAWWYFFRGRRV